MQIHETAIVDSSAEIDSGAEVKAYSVIGPHVKVGPGCVIGPHAFVDGHTTLEADVRIFQFATVGGAPQDLKYHGEPGRLEVGAGTVIREGASVHIGTEDGGMLTRLGKKCFLMGSTHVAHDCAIGDGVIIANNSAVAGHVTIEENVILSGNVAIHQFCHVGKHAFLSGGSLVTQDVMPFCVTQGDRARLTGLNSEGLRRHGYDPDRLRAIKLAYRTIFREGRQQEEALRLLEEELCPGQPDVMHMVAFTRASERGLVPARATGAARGQA